jgi:hypothetical protein
MRDAGGSTNDTLSQKEKLSIKKEEPPYKIKSVGSITNSAESDDYIEKREVR